jgi:hypothetical protein
MRGAFICGVGTGTILSALCLDRADLGVMGLAVFLFGLCVAWRQP